MQRCALLLLSFVIKTDSIVSDNFQDEDILVELLFRMKSNINYVTNSFA